MSEENKPVLGVCEMCNHPIFEPTDLKRVEITKRVGSGRTHNYTTRMAIFCEECNNKRLAEIQRRKEQEEKEKADRCKKRRILSFIFGGIVAAAFIALAITYFIAGNRPSAGGALICAVFGYTFVGSLILKNTFVNDLWLTVASWGFVRMPGVIFELSFDGLVFLIAAKAILFVIGMIIAFIAVILATLLSIVLSVIAYPIGLVKSFKNIED